MRCGLYVTKGANFHLLKLELGEAPTPTNKQDIYMSSIFMLTLIVWHKAGPISMADTVLAVSVLSSSP